MRSSHQAACLALYFSCSVPSAGREAEVGNKSADKGGVVNDNTIIASGQAPDEEKPTPRHEEEQKNLPKCISKSYGKRDKSHPRCRLLEKLCNKIVEIRPEFLIITKMELVDSCKDRDNTGQPADRINASQAVKQVVRDRSIAGIGLTPGSGVGQLSHEGEALGGIKYKVHQFSAHPRPGDQVLHSLVASWSRHGTTGDTVCYMESPSLIINFTTTFKAEKGQYDVLVGRAVMKSVGFEYVDASEQRGDATL
ncbi:hypothetical protein LX32DRAFT_668719 [Colletotrichum zoysiae]|uniref:Uncharacterized protein n=1 Tax=Colletotrichum zoysiae TaxID=1216348 RepID=A0AAD9LU49_9PEZI|nr:hypothetical protein LX32DRAFT_668719 [Colletotrichum zoysiae]